MSSESVAHSPDAPATQGVVLRRAARWYDFLSPPMSFWQENAVNRRVAELAVTRPGAQVLDIGCATGRLTGWVAKHLDAAQGGLAVGLDASPEMVAVARRRARRLPCRFDLGVAEALPYPDETFDCVVSSFFLHHLSGGDKARALAEVRRVLRVGAEFWIADLDTPYNAFGRLMLWTTVRLFRQEGIRENARGILRECLEQAGFEEITLVGHRLGCVNLYRMRKPPENQQADKKRAGQDRSTGSRQVALPPRLS